MMKALEGPFQGRMIDFFSIAVRKETPAACKPLYDGESRGKTGHGNTFFSL